MTRRTNIEFNKNTTMSSMHANNCMVVAKWLTLDLSKWKQRLFLIGQAGLISQVSWGWSIVLSMSFLHPDTTHPSLFLTRVELSLWVSYLNDLYLLKVFGSSTPSCNPWLFVLIIPRHRDCFLQLSALLKKSNN